MKVHRFRAASRPRGLWFWSIAAVTCVALTALGARAQQVGSGTPTSGLGVQAANQVLMAEQLAAQFYNVNAGKSYLGGTIPATPAPGVVVPTVPSAGGNTSTDGTPFTALASGSGEVPSVNTSATATASFILSKDQTTVSYQITVSGLTGPATAVRIRQGPSGQAGGIVLYNLNLPTNGVSSGQFEVRPEDVPTLKSGGMYLEITTAQNPGGEIRGQIVLASGAPAPSGAVVPGGVVVPSQSQGTLNDIVTEIRAGHNAHITTLQQLLGANAQPVPSFQNLDAPTLTQFLTMAQNIEDFAVETAEDALLSASPGAASTTTGTASGTPGASLESTVVAILADDGRYDGGIRAYQKIAGTGAGGNPNTSLTENGQPLNVPRTPAQLNAFFQTYASGSAGTGTSATTTPATTTGTTTTGSTTTGGTTGSTTTGGTTGY